MRSVRSKPERKLALRRGVLLAGWLATILVVVARSAEMQVLEGPRWREAAQRQHRTIQEVPAPRGSIVDRDGFPLAVSREMARVSIAPPELVDRAEVQHRLVEELGLSPAAARRHTDPGERWSVIPGVYEPSVTQPLSGIRGVYVETVHRRFHPRGDLALGLLGAVIDGKGQGGIEEVFDQVLRGHAGSEVAARDHQGREIPGETVVVEPPVGGGEVRLTLDLDLQEIAHQALHEAVEKTGARGGDLVVTDPRTGEVLALASFRDGRGDVLSAVTTPYEPGSTLKPFTVSAILQNRAGRLTDSIDTHGGVWMVGGRPLSDTQDHGKLTLADALRVSSNVGVAMAAQALEHGQQYQALRDFGFGVQTGIPLPGEAPGTLRHPDRWSARSSASLAIGYEIAVTPLQMAMAYGALANGGMLMEPRLVREVAAPGGKIMERRPPRALRRVVSESVTREVAHVLVDVVEDGTGTAARLGTFQVAGKTGTSRAYAAGGGYKSGNYFASFAAFFPAEDPQLVVFVKLEAPKGVYYGGSTAAPVTRETMEAVLASRTNTLDRGALLKASHEDSSQGAPSSRQGARFASVELATGQAASPSFTLPTGALTSALGETTAQPEPRVPGRPLASVPDVAGLSPRVAVRKLHAAGLRVAWDGGSRVARTVPAAGSLVTPGDTVRLMGGGRRR